MSETNLLSMAYYPFIIDKPLYNYKGRIAYEIKQQYDSLHQKSNTSHIEILKSVSVLRLMALRETEFKMEKTYIERNFGLKRYGTSVEDRLNIFNSILNEGVYERALTEIKNFKTQQEYTNQLVDFQRKTQGIKKSVTSQTKSKELFNLIEQILSVIEKEQERLKDRQKKKQAVSETYQNNLKNYHKDLTAIHDKLKNSPQNITKEELNTAKEKVVKICGLIRNEAYAYIQSIQQMYDALANAIPNVITKTVVQAYDNVLGLGKQSKTNKKTGKVSSTTGVVDETLYNPQKQEWENIIKEFVAELNATEWDAVLNTEEDKWEEKVKQQIMKIFYLKTSNYCTNLGNAIYLKTKELLPSALQEEMNKIGAKEGENSDKYYILSVFNSANQKKYIQEILRAYDYTPNTLKNRIQNYLASKMKIEDIVFTKTNENVSVKFSTGQPDLSKSITQTSVKSYAKGLHGFGWETAYAMMAESIAAKVHQVNKKINVSIDHINSVISNSVENYSVLLTGALNNMKADTILIHGHSGSNIKNLLNEYVKKEEKSVRLSNIEGLEKTFRSLFQDREWEELSENERTELENTDLVFITHKMYKYDTTIKEGFRIEDINLETFDKILKKMSGNSIPNERQMVNEMTFTIANTGKQGKHELLGTALSYGFRTELAALFGNFMFDDVVLHTFLSKYNIGRIHIFMGNNIMIPFSVLIDWLLAAISNFSNVSIGSNKIHGAYKQLSDIVSVTIKNNVINDSETEEEMAPLTREFNQDGSESNEKKLYEKYFEQRLRAVKIKYYILKDFYSKMIDSIDKLHLTKI